MENKIEFHLENITFVESDLPTLEIIVESLKRQIEERDKKEKPEPICSWCGNELNQLHNDDMCKYLNR